MCLESEITSASTKLMSIKSGKNKKVLYGSRNGIRSAVASSFASATRMRCRDSMMYRVICSGTMDRLRDLLLLFR